jgi:hypothetical protein
MQRHTTKGGRMSDNDSPDVEHSCGYPEGTFACKIRHLSINTGDAKAAKDKWR